MGTESASHISKITSQTAMTVIVIITESQPKAPKLQQAHKLASKLGGLIKDGDYYLIKKVDNSFFYSFKILLFDRKKFNWKL